MQLQFHNNIEHRELDLASCRCCFVLVWFFILLFPTILIIEIVSFCWGDEFSVIFLRKKFRVFQDKAITGQKYVFFFKEVQLVSINIKLFDFLTRIIQIQPQLKIFNLCYKIDCIFRRKTSYDSQVCQLQLVEMDPLEYLGMCKIIQKLIVPQEFSNFCNVMYSPPQLVKPKL